MLGLGFALYELKPNPYTLSVSELRFVTRAGSLEPHGRNLLSVGWDSTSGYVIYALLSCKGLRKDSGGQGF